MNPLRKQAIQKISQNTTPQCVSCGTTELNLLEINHVNCDGKKEKITPSFYRKIINNTLPLNDYDIRCCCCNWYHYYEHKFKGAKWNIQWIS